MNEELSHTDIEELLERMRPPSTPHESFLKAAPGLKDVKSWHKRNVGVALAGLQTEPEYHANDIRLDWLQRLVLSKAEGKKKPGPKDLQRALNEGLDKANVLRLEDPIEDTFCDLIATREGNFRILPGRWEAAAAYTQSVYDAFCDLPDGIQKAAALETAHALLKLSEEMCKRAGANRGMASGGVPMDKILLPAKERLKVLGRGVRFKASDLERLGIDPRVLEQFCLEETLFPFVSDRPIGDTPLEFCPLLAAAGGVDVIAPTNISLTVRAVLIGTASAGGLAEALQHRLLERQERFSEVTGFWPGGSLRLSPPNKHNLRACLFQYDRGRYLHVIQIPTLFDGFPELGFATVRRLPPEANAAIAADINRFWEFLGRQSECRRATTVLLLSGWGAAHSVAPPIEDDKAPAYWRLLPLSFADAAVLGACDNGKFRHILRLVEQTDRLEADGFTMANPNGLLNLFGFWRMTKGNLVPEHMWDMAPPCNLMLSVDEVLEPRLEALRRQDCRALPLPEGGHKVVQRKDWSDDELDPIYASPADIVQSRLAGAVTFADRTLWIESEAKEGVNRSWQYQVWNAILEWLCIVGPKLAQLHADLFPEGAYRISIVLPQNDSAMGVSADAAPKGSLSECIQIRREGNLATVEITAEWALFLREAENWAEVELVAAVLEAMADRNHSNCSSESIVNLVKTAIASKSWRWLHLQGEHEPLLRLAGLGLIDEFRPISFSAHALVKCGSVWSFRDRALGSKIEGEDACREFLKAYRDNMLDSLVADIRRFDRTSLVVAAARSYQAARHEGYRWRRTIRAQRAIRGGSAADAVAIRRQNEINGVIRAAKSIGEIAACEALLEGGLSPARDEIDEMYAKALLLFGNGQLFATIRGGLIAPNLRISPGGDVLSERDIFSRLLEPGVSWMHVRVLNRADEDYGSERMKPGKPPAERLAWGEGLRAAVEAEYTVYAEAYVDFQFAMVQLAESKGRDVFVARHSEILDALKGNDAYPDVDTGGLVKRLTLKCRPSWHAELSEAEINLSRFDRRFSLINRPLLAIDDADDPAVVVAPGWITDSCLYCISGLHRGDLNNTFWESAAARSYAGARGDAAGHAFEEKVALRLGELGLNAESGCAISKLLSQKVSDKLGNIDIFALTKDKKRAWVIEAKDLRLCRTEAEVAARLSEYRGRTTRNSKGRETPDKLLRHLRRVEFVRERSEALAKNLKLDTPPEVKGLLVVDCPQPMNFHMLDEVPDAASVFLDAIGEFKF